VNINSVLVVDDSESGRYLKVRALRGVGFEVADVATAAAALEYIEEHTTHVAVLDVKLPDMHGFELCRIIKSRFPNIGVLQTSATFTSAEDRVAGLEFGADAYLVEPMEETELVAIVRALLRVRQAEAAQRSTELRFAQFAQASPDVLWIYDVDAGRFEYVSPSVQELLGHSPEDVQVNAEIWLSKIHEDDRPAVERMLRDAGLEGEEPIEYRLQHEATQRWIRDKAFSLPAEAWEGRRVAGLARDVTEAKRAEQQRELLIGELNHRVKNTLALVQALAAHTRHAAVSPSDFEQAFTSRLHALGHAHDLLTQTHWKGTSLHQVIETALAPFSVYDNSQTRVRVNGPQVWLNSNTAVTMTLAFHELATNAAKYGALSTNKGRVEIFWSAQPATEPKEVLLEWRESGGPPVQAPSRKGFGTMLIEKVLAYEAEGEAKLDFLPAGVAFVFRLPLSSNVQLT
jgi:PAS domain S-box-containing protein